MSQLEGKILSSIKSHISVANALMEHSEIIKDISARVTFCLNRGGKVIFMGNGGSAADCQHIAAEFVGRFKKERRGLAAVALTTDTSILTAVGNDYGFDTIFARQIEAICNDKDLIIGISTSGNSSNILKAVELSKSLGFETISFVGGDGGKLSSLTDMSLVVPSNETARIQEMHILVGHIICELVENDF